MAELPTARPFCDWTNSGFSDESESHFDTECGKEFQFSHEPPYDYVRFCCYCGGIVRIIHEPIVMDDDALDE